MTEFEDLSSTEIRLLREHRAQAAIESRPVDKVQVILRLMRIIRDAALAGMFVDPNDPLWVKIFEIIPAVTLD